MGERKYKACCLSIKIKKKVSFQLIKTRAVTSFKSTHYFYQTLKTQYLCIRTVFRSEQQPYKKGKPKAKEVLRTAHPKEAHQTVLTKNSASCL